MSNYELIKLKRFVLLFTVKLSNELFFQLHLMLHAYVQIFDVMDIVEIFLETKYGQSKSCETSFNELLGQPFSFLYHKSSSSSRSGGSGALPTLCLVVFLQSALHSTTTPSPHSLPLSLPPIFDYLSSDCYLSLLSFVQHFSDCSCPLIPFRVLPKFPFLPTFSTSKIDAGLHWSSDPSRLESSISFLQDLILKGNRVQLPCNEAGDAA